MASLAKSAPQAVQHIHFPNESPQYRRARNVLLKQEMELRRQVERVAAQRRALPPGGEIPEDYVFEAAGAGGKPKCVRLSELFAPGKDTLAIYSFMFGPERERPCPGCTHFLVPHEAARLLAAANEGALVRASMSANDVRVLSCKSRWLRVPATTFPPACQTFGKQNWLLGLNSLSQPMTGEDWSVAFEWPRP